MKLTLNLTPIKFEGSTKDEAIENMRRGLRVVYSEEYDRLISELSNDFVFYNMHKHNRRHFQEKVANGQKFYKIENLPFKRNLALIEEGKWVLQAYLIPTSIGEYYGVQFEQLERHFNITSV